MSKSDAVGLFAHQSDRRRRRNRAENPQGEDRSRAAAERREGLETRPEADNLVGIYAALADTTKADVLGEFGGAQFSTFKSALVDLAVAKLGPIARRDETAGAGSGLHRSRAGRRLARASAIAAETMKAVKDIVGLVRH